MFGDDDEPERSVTSIEPSAMTNKPTQQQNLFRQKNTSGCNFCFLGKTHNRPITKKRYVLIEREFSISSNILTSCASFQRIETNFVWQDVFRKTSRFFTFFMENPYPDLRLRFCGYCGCGCGLRSNRR